MINFYPLLLTVSDYNLLKKVNGGHNAPVIVFQFILLTNGPQGDHFGLKAYPMLNGHGQISNPNTMILDAKPTQTSPVFSLSPGQILGDLQAYTSHNHSPIGLDQLIDSTVTYFVFQPVLDTTNSYIYFTVQGAAIDDKLTLAALDLNPSPPHGAI